MSKSYDLAKQENFLLFENVLTRFVENSINKTFYLNVI